MKKNAQALALMMLIPAALILVGCGSREGGATVAAAEAKADSSDDSEGLDPCKLLSEAQVRTVVPDLAGSMVTQRGGSLIKGIDAYQCSYINQKAEGLTVILNVAVDDARFAQIQGGASSFEDAEKPGIGDKAWLKIRDNKLSLTVNKGRTVIDLDLTGPDAAQKSKEMIELARAVTAKVK